MRRLFGNKRGFSLVELIVSFAILGIIAVAIMSFLASSSGAYSSVSSGVTLQFEAQTTMTQLREYIIDCNGAIVYEENTLYVICEAADGADEDDEPDVTVHAFTFDGTAQRLYYKKYASLAGAAPYTGEDGLMSSRMTGFTVTTPDAPPGATSWEINSVSVGVSYTFRTKRYSGEETIALRNTVMTADSLEGLPAAE